MQLEERKPFARKWVGFTFMGFIVSLRSLFPRGIYRHPCRISADKRQANPLLRRKDRNACKGVTLVEVLVALLLTSMVAGGIYSLLTQSMRFAQHNRILTEAHVYAKKEMEDVITSGYTSICSGSPITKKRKFSDSETHKTEIFLTRKIIPHNYDTSVSTNTLPNLGEYDYLEILVTTSFQIPGTSRTNYSTHSMTLGNYWK